jgi:hypothetical protein
LDIVNCFPTMLVRLLVSIYGDSASVQEQFPNLMAFVETPLQWRQAVATLWELEDKEAKLARSSARAMLRSFTPLRRDSAERCVVASELPFSKLLMSLARWLDLRIGARLLRPLSR